MYTKVLIFVATILLASHAVAQQNVVLLKNGNILQGAVERQGDRFQIQTRTSRLVLERSQVAYFCNTIHEAYELTQAASDPESVESQIEVLQWCLKHKLYPQARQQIDILQLLPIKASRLEHLNRQVNVAIERQQRLQARANSPLTPKVTKLPQSNETVKPVSEIAQVGYEKEIQLKPLPDSLPSPTRADKPASLREIAEFTKSFPPEAVSTYKLSVEPHLIANCFNAGCHNGTQSEMPLISQGRGKRTTKTMSQRNFHTLMSYVDLEAPLKSPLYVKATTAHGGITEAVYTEKRGQTKTLRKWLLSIATPEAQLEYQRQQWEIAQQQEAEATAARIKAQTAGSNFEALPGEIRQASAALPDSSIPSVPNLTPKQKVFVPKDPFDPEIFNRKFGKK